MLKLDRNRPFGEVHGTHIAPCGAPVRFEQDGLQFDAQGDIIESMLTDEKREQMRQAERRRRAREMAEKVYRDALADAGVPEDADAETIKAGIVDKIAESRDREADAELPPPVARKEGEGEGEGGADQPATGLAPEDIDINAYFLGEKKYPVKDVLNSAKVKWGIVKANTMQLAAWMIENDHLEESDIKIRLGGSRG